MTTINVFTENLREEWELDERKIISYARKFTDLLIKKCSEIRKDDFCLKGYDYKVISYDILFCGSEKTHELNRDYREKDAPADIITFAVFADDENRFMFDGEINLGEIIIATDKVEDNAKEKGVTRDHELYFLIAHGILHLLGFDHQSEEDYNLVVKLQNEVLQEVINE